MARTVARASKPGACSPASSTLLTTAPSSPASAATWHGGVRTALRTISQQTRWSRLGANLLQVRWAVYNGTLGSGFGQLFEPAPNSGLHWAEAT